MSKITVNLTGSFWVKISWLQAGSRINGPGATRTLSKTVLHLSVACPSAELQSVTHKPTNQPTDQPTNAG